MTENKGSEWYFMKGRNIRVKNIIKPFLYYCERDRDFIKDIHREKAPANKNPALTKSINMDIRVVVTSNQLFLKGS